MGDTINLIFIRQQRTNRPKLLLLIDQRLIKRRLEAKRMSYLSNSIIISLLRFHI